MPGQYCFLCASDEGFFVDITSENRALFGNQLDTCFSTKVSEAIELSTKICYKCAYELEQCTKFIQKCKKSREVSKSPKIGASTPYCSLCYESVKSGHIFDITKDNRAIFTPLQKIRNIFDEDLTKRDSSLICLTCRYNLDLSYDLKKLHHEIVNIKISGQISDEIDYSIFPKVRTDVVHRKTTITTCSDITFYTLLSSDSEISDDMALQKRMKKGRIAAKSRNNEKSKARNCDECHKAVTNGNDMYRFHHSGQTVCKSCWITMDPSKGKAKRRPRNNSAETKLCAVFLKDVLSEGSYKGGDKADKDKVSVTSDSSSQDEEASKSPKIEIDSRTVNGSARRGRKRRISATKSDAEVTLPKLRRLSKSRECTSANEMNHEMESTSKASFDVEQPSTSSPKRQLHKRKATRSDQSSDSDLQSTPRKTDSNKWDDLAKCDLPPTVDATAANRSGGRKKLKSILEGVTRKLRLEPSDESSSNESNVTQRSRETKTKSTTSIPSTSKAEVEIQREVRSRTRSSSRSISSEETTLSTEFKSPKSVTASEVKAEYSCDKCSKKFNTKLLNIEHKLTHLKQATLKLERVNIPSDEKKREMKVDSQEDRTTTGEAKAHSSRRIVSTRCEEPSEEIAINVEDDTDDEEIFNFLRKETTKKTEKGKKRDKSNDGDGDVIDKTDAVENKSHEKEEEEEEKSNEIENDEEEVTEKFQEHEDSTTVPDETVMPDEEVNKGTGDEEDNEIDRSPSTTVKQNTDVSKDKDNRAEDVVVTTEDRKDSDVRYEDAEVAEDAKISATREENRVNTYNDDEENLDETAENSEALLLLRTKNDEDDNMIDDHKDHDCDDFENDLGDICNDNEEETMEDVEQSLLTSDFHDAKESEAKEGATSDVADRTGALNESLDDTIISEDNLEDVEKRQNGIDIMDVDETNIVEDSVRSDFTNCEMLDNAKIDDADDGDLATVSLDSDDDISFVESNKIITDDTITMNDTTRKSKLTENMEDFELIEEKAMNNKYEVQEDANHASDNNPTKTANEILSEVFDLAAAEAQRREDDSSAKNLVDDVELETLENISREIRNSADMPSLDPISVMEIDDDNDITLN